MKKITILLLLILCSCGGTRKTNTTQNENITIENKYNTSSKIVLGNTFTYRPFDVSKPMKIDSRTYENVIILNDKTVTKEHWKNKTIYKTITIEKTKATTRENNDFLYIGLFLVLVLGVLGWFKLPSFKKGI